MTTQFVNNYFSNTAFYKLTFAAEIDNPDQRISEDINSFTQKSIYFLLIFIETGLQLIAFCGVLWSISQLLVYFIVVYAIVGTLVTTMVFGRPLAFAFTSAMNSPTVTTERLAPSVFGLNFASVASHPADWRLRYISFARAAAAALFAPPSANVSRRPRC